MFMKKYLAAIPAAALAVACQNASAESWVVVGDSAPMQTEGTSVGYSSEGGVLTLNAPLAGPLFCGNPLLSGENPTNGPIRIAPTHGNWILPTATDVGTVAYTGGVILRVNAPPTVSSLMCYGASESGWPRTSFRGGLFSQGFEDALPTNPYAGDTGEASVTGITDALADGPRMLTQIDPNGNVYMYMFRLRASAPGGSDVRVLIRDGYDASVLGDTAWHCQRTTLPSGPIDLRAICSSDPNTITSSGPIKREYLLNDSSTDRYIVVHRLIVGSPLRNGSPIAGAAVFVRPGPTMDRFTGDNLVFSIPPLP